MYWPIEIVDDPIAAPSSSSRWFCFAMPDPSLQVGLIMKFMHVQYEGGAMEGSRGPSIWDTFTHQHPGMYMYTTILSSRFVLLYMLRIYFVCNLYVLHAHSEKEVLHASSPCLQACS